MCYPNSLLISIEKKCFMNKLLKNKIMTITAILIFTGVLLSFAKLTNNATKSKTTDNERFVRPSKAEAYQLKYSYLDTISSPPAYLSKKFETAQDVIEAYFATIAYASNSAGHSGFGSSFGTQPYSYAYDLFTSDFQKEVTLEQFIDYLQGVQHTTLLKLNDSYSPPDTPSVQNFMAEFEIITGPKVSAEEPYKYQNQINYFGYYYGIISAENTSSGWKIKDLYFLPEEFTYAPGHGWFYRYDYVLDIIYLKNGIIDKIDKVDDRYPYINAYVQSKGAKYLIVFIRLTNGYDVVLNEYKEINHQYVKTSILPSKYQSHNPSILNPVLQQKSLISSFHND